MDLQARVLETRQTVVTVLLTDLDLAWTFVTIAKTASRPEIRRRNLENARKVCGSVRSWLPRLGVTPELRKFMESKVSAVEEQLVGFGVAPDRGHRHSE